MSVTITLSGVKLEAEMCKYLDRVIAEKSGHILQGVPLDAYKERVAELRAFQAVRAAIPGIVTKARE